MRFILLGVPLLFLSGCAIPPAIAIGSYAADGLSYLVTGKSVSDHAISEVVGEDCATWRMVKLENPCREYEEGEGSIFAAGEDGADADGAREMAALDEDETYDDRTVEKVPVIQVSEVPVDSDAARGPVADSSHEVTPRQVAISSPAAGNGAGEIAVEQIPDARPLSPNSWTEPANAKPALASDRGILLVMGSFSRKTNAERLARAQADFEPVVMSARIGGATYYRVVTRAGPAADLSDVRRRLSAAGIRKTWRIRWCVEVPRASGCVAWNESFRPGAVQVAAAN